MRARAARDFCAGAKRRDTGNREVRRKIYRAPFEFPFRAKDENRPKPRCKPHRFCFPEFDTVWQYLFSKIPKRLRCVLLFWRTAENKCGNISKNAAEDPADNVRNSDHGSRAGIWCFPAAAKIRRAKEKDPVANRAAHPLPTS